MKRSVSLPSPPAAYARPEQKPAAAHKPAHSAHPLEVGSQPTERGVLSYPTLVSGLIQRGPFSLYGHSCLLVTPTITIAEANLTYDLKMTNKMSCRVLVYWVNFRQLLLNSIFCYKCVVVALHILFFTCTL